MPRIEKGEWVWTLLPTGWKVVGEVKSWQESCPNVGFNCMVLDADDKVQLSYSSFCRHDMDVDIIFMQDGKWQKVEYLNDKLYNNGGISAPTLPGAWNTQQGIDMTKDECGIFSEETHKDE